VLTTDACKAILAWDTTEFEENPAPNHITYEDKIRWCCLIHTVLAWKEIIALGDPE